ncbi:MAG: hypothetical protein FJ104_01405 [Deltaproteobacteria bacterium]|nr:hypothetical protein [Deltaproteobacteria bacterium]
MRTRLLARAFVLPSLLLAACGGDESGGGTGARADAGADAGDSGDGGPAVGPRRLVTADWMNRSLSVLDYDAVVGGAATRDEALVRTIPIDAAGAGPIEVAMAPGAGQVLVAVGPGFFDGVVGGLLGVSGLTAEGTALLVDLESGEVLKDFETPAAPMGAAVTADGALGFTSDHKGSTLSVHDLSGRRRVTSIEVGGKPEEVSVSPDGKAGVVNTDSDESLCFFETADPAGTLTPPLHVGGDPGRSTFVPIAKKVVTGKSLNLSGTDQPGYAVLDVSDLAAPRVLEHVLMDDGVPYAADLIPGTTRVLLTLGVSQCALREVDVGGDAAVEVRTIVLPCEKPGLPLSAVVDAEGKYAFVGIVGDNALFVVDLGTGESRRIPWLPSAGPTDVELTR